MRHHEQPRPGVDVLQETIAGGNSASSTELQASFFDWRDAYPGSPYWVHLQHTDVHWPWEPVPPTAGQRVPRHLQGQSLAPLLLGKPGWKAKPVVLAEFNHDDKQGFAKPGELYGEIEMIDGRWGASLHIGPKETAPEGPAFLLYDLWRDPYCLKSVQAEHPDLAKSCQQRLEAEFRAQLNLGKRFPRAAPGTLNSEQLKTLKSLGYL